MHGAFLARRRDPRIGSTVRAGASLRQRVPDVDELSYHLAGLPWRKIFAPLEALCRVVELAVLDAGPNSVSGRRAARDTSTFLHRWFAQAVPNQRATRPMQRLS